MSDRASVVLRRPSSAPTRPLTLRIAVDHLPSELLLPFGGRRLYGGEPVPAEPLIGSNSSVPLLAQAPAG